MPVLALKKHKLFNSQCIHCFNISFSYKKNPDTTHTIMLKERENGNFLSATKVELLQTYKNESKLEYKIIQEYETDEQGRFVTAPLERGNFYLRIKTIEEPSYIQPLEFGSEYAIHKIFTILSISKSASYGYYKKPPVYGCGNLYTSAINSLQRHCV